MASKARKQQETENEAVLKRRLKDVQGELVHFPLQCHSCDHFFQAITKANSEETINGYMSELNSQLSKAKEDNETLIKRIEALERRRAMPTAAYFPDEHPANVGMQSLL